MDIRWKKVVAREFLILIGMGIVYVLVYVGYEGYNIYLTNKIDELETVKITLQNDIDLKRDEGNGSLILMDDFLYTII